jgi:XTP/dITP diphosphohydrolase
VSKKLVFASTNAGKLKELRELVGDALEVVSPKDLPPMAEVVEDGATFEANAEKKARGFAAATRFAALADDSGLCVDVLGGRPGVQSARYAADDAGRIARLLKELHGVPKQQRTARFECALALVLPTGECLIETGRCEGLILDAPRGSGGFGYDPIFYVERLSRSMAELTSSEKSAVSHRGEAFRKMRPHLLRWAQS